MRFFIVICGLFGLYSQIPMSVMGTEIPNIIGLSAGALLLGLNFNRMQISHLKAMLAVLGVALLSIVLAPQVVAYMPSRILALAQLFVSMVTGYGLYLEIRKRSALHMARLLLGFCVIILIGSALEAFTPLRAPIGNLSMIFFDYDFEQQLLRDLNIAGFSRPVFLTSEPSHVAKGLIILSISALILNPTQRMAFWVAGILMLGLVVVRSPSIVIGLVMVFIVQWYVQRRHLRRVERSRRSVRILFLLLIIGAPLVAGSFVLLADRIAQVLSGNDFSATARLFASINIGLNEAMRYPITGVGLGGFEVSQDTIIATLVDNGVPGFTAEEAWERQLNNGIGTHLLYFGLILLPIYLLAFYRLLDRLSLGNGTMILLLMVCISFLTGGIYSPRFVMYYFLFASVAHIAFHTTFAEPNRTIARPIPQLHMQSNGICRGATA